MRVQNVVKWLRSNWWFVLGVMGFLGVFVRAAISLEANNAGELLFHVIDWLAASVMYFFLGALIGGLIDCRLAKRQNKKRTFEWWWYATTGFWIASVGVSISMLGFTKVIMNWEYFLFFPAMFGIFLPASAYELLVGGLIRNPLVKFILNSVFMGVFLAWLIAEITKKKLLQRVLLVTIFLVLSLGMFGCLSALR